MSVWYQLALTLLFGWGAGWFVARSSAGNFIRAPLAWVAKRAADGVRPDDGWDDFLRFCAGKLRGGSIPPSNKMLLCTYLLSLGCVMAPVILVQILAAAVQCAACSGFWIGVFIGQHRPLAGNGLGGAVVTGVVVMGVNAFLDAMTGAHAASERVSWASVEALEQAQIRPPEPSDLTLAEPTGENR